MTPCDSQILQISNWIYVIWTVWKTLSLVKMWSSSFSVDVHHWTWFVIPVRIILLVVEVKTFTSGVIKLHYIAPLTEIATAWLKSWYLHMCSLRFKFTTFESQTLSTELQEHDDHFIDQKLTTGHFWPSMKCSNTMLSLGPSFLWLTVRIFQQVKVLLTPHSHSLTRDQQALISDLC